MVILRPSVYICAEWEFGGLPAAVKRTDAVALNRPRFMAKVRNYFQVLLPKLVPLQITHGGPVIMMQVENEYGSYGMEKAYLRQTKELMEECGIDVPLFTSDGAWEEVLDAGTLIEDDVFVTAISAVVPRKRLWWKSLWQNMAKTGPSCAWNIGMAGSTAGASQSSSETVKT